MDESDVSYLIHVVLDGTTIVYGHNPCVLFSRVGEFDIMSPVISLNPHRSKMKVKLMSNLLST
jgi:hypothetical protein